MALLLGPAREFASEETFIQTPALELANAWRAAALPVGIGLMLLVAVLRLLRDGAGADGAGRVALVGARRRASWRRSPG